LRFRSWNQGASFNASVKFVHLVLENSVKVTRKDAKERFGLAIWANVNMREIPIVVTNTLVHGSALARPPRDIHV
jgi:hypothetical protein